MKQHTRPFDPILRDGEQLELGLMPIETPTVVLPPGHVVLGRGVKIGLNVKIKPTGT